VCSYIGSTELKRYNGQSVNVKIWWYAALFTSDQSAWHLVEAEQTAGEGYSPPRWYVLASCLPAAAVDAAAAVHCSADEWLEMQA